MTSVGTRTAARMSRTSSSIVARDAVSAAPGLHLPHTIREPGASLVEHQHASRFGETLDVAYEQRLLPGGEQVAGRAADEDEVGRALADNLVGDRDVAAACVADFGRPHCTSFTHR